jgi:hypothetical protein
VSTIIFKSKKNFQEVALGISCKIKYKLRKLDIALLKDSAIPLLGIYAEDAPTCNKDTCSTMFIAALFIIVRSCKEPRCPSTEKWIHLAFFMITGNLTSGLRILYSED